MAQAKIQVVTEDEILWSAKAVTLMANRERMLALSKVLNEQEEDGWTYEVQAHGCCYQIAVYDEEGLFLGCL